MNCRVITGEMNMRCGMKCAVTAGVSMWKWKLQREMELTGSLQKWASPSSPPAFYRSVVEYFH